MSRSIYLVQQAFTSLRRNALVVAAAILAVFVSLTLAFGALVVNELFQATTARWQEGVAVVVFLNDDVGQPAQLDLQREIQAWDEVEETIFCDKTCAYLEFQEMFADQPALLEEVDPSVLPPSIRINLYDPDTYRDITFRLAGAPAVKRIRSASESIDRLSSLSQGLNAFGLGLATLLGVASVVLIANTIRMAIYARRDEVSVMKLVGASNWFIRIPLLLRSPTTIRFRSPGCCVILHPTTTGWSSREGFSEGHCCHPSRSLDWPTLTRGRSCWPRSPAASKPRGPSLRECSAPKCATLHRCLVNCWKRRKQKHRRLKSLRVLWANRQQKRPPIP